MMLIQNKYEIGAFVYLVTDPEQHKRIVTEIRISKNGIIYQLSFGANNSDHFEFEFSSEKDFINAF